jgi:hypothetical protein
MPPERRHAASSRPSSQAPLRGAFPYSGLSGVCAHTGHGRGHLAPHPPIAPKNRPNGLRFCLALSKPPPTSCQSHSPMAQESTPLDPSPHLTCKLRKNTMSLMRKSAHKRNRALISPVSAYQGKLAITLSHPHNRMWNHMRIDTNVPTISAGTTIVVNTMLARPTRRVQNCKNNKKMLILTFPN